MAILVSNDKVCYDVTLFPVLKCANIDEQQHIHNGVPKPFSFVHMFFIISRNTYYMICYLKSLMRIDLKSLNKSKLEESIKMPYLISIFDMHRILSTCEVKHEPK